MNDSGATYEYGIAISAARWNTTSTPSVAALDEARVADVAEADVERGPDRRLGASSSQPAEPREL